MISYGQRLIPSTPYEIKMDSVAIANLKIYYIQKINHDVIYFRPIERVKLSFSSHINSTNINRNNIISIFNSNTGFLEFYDLANIITYDIRLKIYFNKNISFIGRCFVNGTKPSTRLYTVGFQIRV